MQRSGEKPAVLPNAICLVPENSFYQYCGSKNSDSEVDHSQLFHLCRNALLWLVGYSANSFYCSIKAPSGMCTCTLCSHRGLPYGAFMWASSSCPVTAVNGSANRSSLWPRFTTPGQWGLQEGRPAHPLAHTASRGPHWPGVVNRGQRELRLAEPVDAAGTGNKTAHKVLSTAFQILTDVSHLSMMKQEMLETNNVITFNGLANSSNYHTFLLDEERSRLYVGAKDHIFSFNLVNIKEYQKIFWPVSHTRRDECKWAGKDILKECANFIKVLKAYNQTHLYACGTGAFHPVCTYIEIGRHPEKMIAFHASEMWEWGQSRTLMALETIQMAQEDDQILTYLGPYTCLHADNFLFSPHQQFGCLICHVTTDFLIRASQIILLMGITETPGKGAKEETLDMLVEVLSMEAIQGLDIVNRVVQIVLC
ncbi:Semaphorin-3A [Chelonia mydas]|uniref:Semaphorin-3A n=1 Tax=Chelonia mydas TaxID=8469 RepID=M7BGG9_CHEMY|nr:Semaphorin-3A [Chelonia mydas]